MALQHTVNGANGERLFWGFTDTTTTAASTASSF